ncbi:hypothetical protein ABLN87_05355 [Ruegeria sp. SCPT10]|uniref:hypothetical protein n=1 Tax=Ruegeria sp. SCP10 TaxID=3141377 RepID=UPI00333CF2E8
MRVKILQISLLAFLPQTGFAVQLNDCARLFDGHHFGETGHQVVGDGVVAFNHGGLFCWDETGCTETESLIVSACQTGQTLTIATQLNRELDNTLLDRRDEAERTLRLLVNDKASRTWVSLKRTFVNKAFRVDETMETAENCACAAAFPELRNGKQKFEGL